MSNPQHQGSMLVNLTIKPNENLMEFTVSGRLDMSLIVEQANLAIERPDFVPGMNSLWDLTGAEIKHLFGDDIKTAAKIPRKDASERGQARVAILVADELGYGMSRIFHAVAGLEHISYEIFKDEQEARRWLAQ